MNFLGAPEMNSKITVFPWKIYFFLIFDKIYLKNKKNPAIFKFYVKKWNHTGLK